MRGGRKKRVKPKSCCRYERLSQAKGCALPCMERLSGVRLLSGRAGRKAID